MFRSLKEDVRAVIDLGVVLMIGIAFAGMVVLGFVMYVVVAALDDNLPSDPTWWGRDSNSTMLNITTGFDSAINLILVAITIFILALAISALLLLRRR